MIFLADNPGMLPGPASERAGVLRAGGRMFAAQTLATTTKIHLTLRKAYGFGSMVMAMCPYDGQSASYAYPGATLGAMGAGAHARAAGADATAAAALRDAEQQAAYRSAERFSFDELIDPRHTRRILADALSLAVAGRDPAPRPVARIGITP